MKKFFRIIGALIGIPILVYFLMSMANLFILKLIGQINHINIYKESAIQLNNLLSPYIYVGSTIGEFLAVILLIIIYLPSNEGLIKRCKFKKFSLNKLPIILCLIIGFSILSIVYIHLTQGMFKSYTAVEKNLSVVHQSILGVIGTIILVPIFEEIIFRATIFGTLKRNLNIIIALVLQALVFSIMHGNILQMSYTFFLGLILALVFLYTGSLLGDIICHITFNLFGVLILPIISYFYYNSAIYIIIGACLLFISFILYKKNKKSSQIFN